MSKLSPLLLWGSAFFPVLALLLLLRRPLGRLFRLCVRTSAWLALLAVGRHLLPASLMLLGVNWANALVLGLLGAPGLGLLLMVNWLLGHT